jgi:hypothetical protein
LKSYFLTTAANNALPQVGAGHCNVRFSSLSTLVWGLTLSKNLFGNFIIIFLIGIGGWADVFQNPHLRQCKTLAASIKDLTQLVKQTIQNEW